MNRALAAYINSLQPLGMRVWLHLIEVSTPNGNAIVNYRELSSLYDADIEIIKKVFLPKKAEKLKLIKCVETETMLIVNFKTVGRPATGRKQYQKKKKELPSDLPATGETAIVKAAPTIKIEFTEKLKKHILYDYSQFYKGLQISRMSGGGVPIPETFIPVNPHIGGQEVRKFRELAEYFVSAGCKDEGMIVRSFQRIYSHWDQLDDWCQNGISPSAMLRNINQIILQIQKLNTNGKKSGTTKRDNELREKIDEAGQQDYSHLVKKRSQHNN